MRITARYSGRCKCGRRVRVGTEIEWSRDQGVTGCERCGFSGQPPDIHRNHADEDLYIHYYGLQDKDWL